MAVSRREALARRGRATYQDVLDAPAHLVAEIIGGTLHAHPRPAMPHALASSHLSDELVGPYGKGRGGPGGWWIVFEPELHLGEEIVVPDLAGWRRERMPEYPQTAYATLAPDWACEVLSPSTRRGWTSRRSDRSTRAKASRTSGSSTRRTGRRRRSSSATGSGCSSRTRRTTSQ